MANKTGRTYEAPDMAAFLRRTMRAMVRRAADGDQEVLAALVETRAQLDEALRDAARALHDRGHSWAFIGNELGMTRQAAFQRFAPREVKSDATRLLASGQLSIDDAMEAAQAGPDERYDAQAVLAERFSA